MRIKKIIFTCIFLTPLPTISGTYADIAKTKFESEMTQAIQSLDTTEENKNKVIASLPQTEQDLRGFVRDGLKEKKSCLKIKRDFIAHEKSLPPEESSGNPDFDAKLLSAAADYVATICLDMK